MLILIASLIILREFGEKKMVTNVIPMYFRPSVNEKKINVPVIIRVLEKLIE